MRNCYSFSSLLLSIVILLNGCTSSEDTAVEVSPPNQTWTAVGYAVKDTLVDETRALFWGGNDGERYYNLWDEGDQILVYKDDVHVGTQIPTTYGRVNTDLTGTITGTYSVNDALKLYILGPEIDYTGQKGSIEDLSSHYAYMRANSTVSTVDADNHFVSMSAMSFQSLQTYVRFILMDNETGDRLHPKRLDVKAVSGGSAVAHIALDGTVTTTDVLTITPEVKNGEYPGELFVSILNNEDAAVTYQMKAYVGDDVYVGPLTGSGTGYGAYTPSLAANKGQLRNAIRYLRKTTPATSLTVADIPSRVFTGSAYEPVVTVTDGEDALTLGTDYSVSYADNTNVGEATVTVKGLADAGAVAATKYLGTQDKTFQITQATPVITMPTEEEMTLELGLTRQRAVSSVTLDNSAFGLDNLDIMAAPYNCTITYSSANPAIATVSSDGTVTGVVTGTTTITVTVAEAQNWTSKTATYTVKVSPRVNTSGNATWTTTEEAESGNVYQ